MTYPLKLSEPERSPAGLFWSIAIVLTVAWVYFTFSHPSFAPTSSLHTPLLSSLSILIIAAAVWRWSGRWWVLLLIFTSPFILWPLHTTILDTLPLLGLLIFTFFAPQAHYAPNYANEPDIEEQHSNKRFFAEVAAVTLLALQPQSAGLGAFIIWLRSDKKWWVAACGILALLGAFFSVWPNSMVQPTPLLSAPLWPWGLVVGIVLFWISIGQRDALIGGASTLFFLPTLVMGSITTFFVVLAVRLPKIFLVLSATIWIILTISGYPILD